MILFDWKDVHVTYVVNATYCENTESTELRTVRRHRFGECFRIA